MTALSEHLDRPVALATNPRQFDKPSDRITSATQQIKVGETIVPYLTLSFNASPTSSVKLFGQHSTNLLAWDPGLGKFILTNRLRNPDGSYRVLYRYDNPNPQEKEFIRIKADSN